MPEQRYHLCAPPILRDPLAPIVRGALPPAFRKLASIEITTADNADLDLVLVPPKGRRAPKAAAVADWLNAYTIFCVDEWEVRPAASE